MSRKIEICMLILTLGGWGVRPVLADLRWEDAFDGSTLDSAWVLTTSGVASWSGQVAEGRFTMDQMSAADNNSWCEVNLHRPLGCLDDFLVTVDAGWASTSLQAMQDLFVEVRGASGQSLALGGFDDAWFGQRGSLLAHVDDQWWQSGAGTQPYSSPLQVVFAREGGQCRVLLDGVGGATCPWRIRRPAFGCASATTATPTPACSATSGWTTSAWKRPSTRS